MRLLLFGLIAFPFLPLFGRATVAATGEIVVENVNGPIIIETWDKPEVHLEAVKSADLKALDVRIGSSEQRFAVKTVYLDKEGSWLKKFTNTGEVRYTLTIPHTASLRLVKTVNGAIEMRKR